MRKTKRRVFKSKRRRTTQRKFKYQRGGDPEEELKSQVENAIKLADDKTSNAKIKYNEWNTAQSAAYKVLEKSKEQAIVAKKFKSSSIMGMFSSAPKDNPQETAANAELVRLTDEANRMFAGAAELFKEWRALVVEKQEMIKQALQQLETFVDKFPQNSNISGYHEQIKTYRDKLMYGDF
jgi:hypothetical protein